MPKITLDKPSVNYKKLYINNKISTLRDLSQKLILLDEKVTFKDQLSSEDVSFQELSLFFSCT